MDGARVIITEGVFENLKYETALTAARASDTVKVKIDGTSWNPVSVMGLKANKILSIIANENPINKTVALRVPCDISPGIYDLDILGAKYVGVYNPNPNTAWASFSGKLRVVEHNTATKRIRGYFNFTAKSFTGTGSSTLTDGYFSVTYQ